MNECFKQFLVSVPIVAKLNTIWKANSAVKRYGITNSFYQNAYHSLSRIPLDIYVRNLLEERISTRKLNIINSANRDLRILYVGTDWLQDSAGFLQSLRKFGKVYSFTKSNGEYGHHFYEKGNLGKKLCQENGDRLLNLVKSIQTDGGIDIVLGQMWARTIPWQALRAIQDMGIMTINICMDDRHSFRGKKYNGQWMGTAGLIPGLDLALTAAPEIVLWYAVEGIPALFWPEASNPDFFHPMNIQKKHDVCFVGANYGIRTKIVSTLKKKGIQVTCFGEGWPNGRISTKTIPELFASSRIILGVGTIGYCEDFYSLKMRDFDAPMSGSLYITHNNPDLARVYEVGKEIVTYKTIDECVEKVNFYLNQPEQANRIAEAGYKRAMKDHTWKCRFEKLFQAVGLI